ncbi:uncharacterized protein TNCV_1815801 [Trichonephila clavipes]|nr:uncharacterized protein TNCV_1815801 [Trichonephila clavipes]
MIAASPLSPDEYAMRIATQTESALICKEYSSPFIVSPIPVFPAPQRTPSIGRRVACVVCLAISPAVCRLFLLACKTMYRSSAGVVPRGRPLLNPRIAVPVV